MNPRTLFAVLLRATGVWEFVSGVEGLPNSIIQLMQSTHPEFAYAYWASLISFSGMRIAAGLLLFFGGTWFATFVYRDSLPAGQD